MKTKKLLKVTVDRKTWGRGDQDEDNALITSSAVVAAEAHMFQVRKELNEPYIIHPLRVGKMAAEYGFDSEFIAACHLHDVLEDTKFPEATLNRMFPSGTMFLVELVTKWWESGVPDPKLEAEYKSRYYEDILRETRACSLKILDRIDNLRDFAKVARMGPSSHKWAERYLLKTKKELIPISDKAPIDIASVFDTALNELERAVS